MRSAAFLLEIVAVEPVSGGLAALAGIATRQDAPPVFVKAFADAPDDDVFTAEAEGLAALRESGMATPTGGLVRLSGTPQPTPGSPW
jgi:fructosamine-3-kinase